MWDVREPATLGEAAPDTETQLMLPALRSRRQRPLDPRVDRVRRELWRAFQRGALSEEELASTLERLEFNPSSLGLGPDGRP